MVVRKRLKILVNNGWLHRVQMIGVCFEQKPAQKVREKNQIILRWQHLTLILTLNLTLSAATYARAQGMNKFATCEIGKRNNTPHLVKNIEQSTKQGKET